MSKKNKFNLSRKASKAADNIVLEVQVKYDIDEDAITIECARRVDVVDDKFTVRMSRQVEHALRQIFPAYAEEMSFIELVAGVDVSSCRCGK